MPWQRVTTSTACGGRRRGSSSSARGSPVQGEEGCTEVVDSVRLEFCLPRDPQRLQRIFEQGVVPHHPWRVPVVQVEEVELLLTSGQPL